MNNLPGDESGQISDRPDFPHSLWEFWAFKTLLQNGPGLARFQPDSPPRLARLQTGQTLLQVSKFSSTTGQTSDRLDSPHSLARFQTGQTLLPDWPDFTPDRLSSLTGMTLYWQAFLPVLKIFDQPNSPSRLATLSSQTGLTSDRPDSIWWLARLNTGHTLLPNWQNIPIGKTLLANWPDFRLDRASSHTCQTSHRPDSPPGLTRFHTGQPLLPDWPNFRLSRFSSQTGQTSHWPDSPLRLARLHNCQTLLPDWPNFRLSYQSLGFQTSQATPFTNGQTKQLPDSPLRLARLHAGKTLLLDWPNFRLARLLSQYYKASDRPDSPLRANPVKKRLFVSARHADTHKTLAQKFK